MTQRHLHQVRTGIHSCAAPTRHSPQEQRRPGPLQLPATTSSLPASPATLHQGEGAIDLRFEPVTRGDDAQAGLGVVVQLAVLEVPVTPPDRPATIRSMLGVVGDVARWMQQEADALAALEERPMEAFLAARRRRPGRHARSGPAGAPWAG